jgi:hypothetical protein
MEIKYNKDWRKQPKWEKVQKMEFRQDYGYDIVWTFRFGWVLLKDCKVRNGNFNTIVTTKNIHNEK